MIPPNGQGHERTKVLTTLFRLSMSRDPWKHEEGSDSSPPRTVHSVTLQFNWHERDMHASSPRTVQNNLPHSTPLPPNIQHNCYLVFSHWLSCSRLADHFLEMVSGSSNVLVAVASMMATSTVDIFLPCDPCQPQQLPSLPLCPCHIECDSKKLAVQPPFTLRQRL